MKFAPQPGDKIICNNCKEFICCNLNELELNGVGSYLKDEPGTIFGISENWDKDYLWAYWKGEDYPKDHEWKIREVILQEPLVDSKELLYTVEEVTEAFANALHYSWMGGRQAGIDKVKDYLSKKHNAEYQEYLRLKAIYE